MSLPPAPDLIAVVREFLEAEILPLARDEKWFNVKVATNLLGMVERELRLGPQANITENERLAAIVGEGGTHAERNRRLSDAIRSGRLSWDNEALVAHLRASIADALRINNPKWLDSGTQIPTVIPGPERSEGARNDDVTGWT